MTLPNQTTDCTADGLSTITILPAEGTDVFS